MTGCVFELLAMLFEKGCANWVSVLMLYFHGIALVSVITHVSLKRLIWFTLQH